MTASRSTVYGSAAGIAGSYRSHGLASLGTDHREAENTVIIANQELREACFSSVASVRRMALIGSFATRAVMPSRCGSLSLSPTCASRASVNMQHRTSRLPVPRFPPARLSLMIRKSSTDACVKFRAAGARPYRLDIGRGRLQPLVDANVASCIEFDAGGL